MIVCWLWDFCSCLWVLQYATTLMSLFNLENQWVMPSWVYRYARCTFLNSRLSVCVLISVLGQLDGSCESHCSSFHHSVDLDSVEASIPSWNEISKFGLRWHISPLSWCSFFLNKNNSVAYKCLPCVWCTLYPCKYNGSTCIYVGLIYCYVEWAYVLLVQFGHQWNCTKFQYLYSKLFKGCHIWCGTKKFTRCFLVTVCVSNVEASSLGLFTDDTNACICMLTALLLITLWVVFS